MFGQCVFSVPPDVGISAQWKQAVYSEHSWGLLGLRFCLLWGKSADDPSVKGWLKLTWENISCSPCPEARVLVRVLVQMLLCQGWPGDCQGWPCESDTKKWGLGCFTLYQHSATLPFKESFCLPLFIPLEYNKNWTKPQVNPRNRNPCSLRCFSTQEKELLLNRSEE